MKACELRMMFLTVAITLGLAFALSQRQTKTLREQLQVLEGKLEAETERTNQTLIKFANARAELERLGARGEVLSMSLDATRDLMTREPQRYTWNLLHTVKRGFNDIQTQVAAGRFPGLGLTDCYMEMKQVLDNPAFEEMLASDHGLTGR